MNKLCFQSFLRSNDKDSLRCTSSKTAQEVVSLRSLSEDVSLHVCVGTETDLILGDGEKQEGTVTSVETEDTALTEGLLDSANHTLLVDLRVQLHDSLGVLSGVGAGNFNSASNTTYSKIFNVRSNFIFLTYQ